ncbi:MAG: tRNA (adenosine(37)-N6)-dimethylallyltransferase MiaA [Gammaproteobacteria bacterium]|nr:tRNA (adenosine(37)-N6)-dimethylallyltransferase MiaA [Gammaproteobacteria bacterium]
MKLNAIVITGPTASGKSDLAIEIARTHSMEIVSVDSALVYRTMDIGTAKPGEKVRQEISHHLIDIRDPGDPYSAAEFRADAIKVIEDIHHRGNTPLLVGGTMLYLKALKDGIAELPSADPQIRARILEQAENEGWLSLHERLQQVDPEAALRISCNDPQRLQRALEVYEITGETITDLHRLKRSECPFHLVEVAIMPTDRKALHQRIAERFEKMLARGFMAEVQELYERGDLSPDLPSIKAVGYRQAWAHLQGEIDYATMRERAITATRQLAKRQFTWLRSWKNLNVIGSPDRAQVLKILKGASILPIS